MRTQAEQERKTLEDVAPGERGVILKAGNERGAVKRRLVDMGLTPGTEITVPAVMGARTMENEKDRRMTIMLVPFMSCSARLPVYGLLTAAFFPRYGGAVVFSLYLLGLLFAIASGILL